MYTTLIQASELMALRASGTPVRVFDCSFDLAQPDAGPAQFAQVHVAGATHADLDHDLSAHGGSVAQGTAASGGRHPLPSREQFARWMGAQGIAPGVQVVVYDRQNMNFCGRLWWMLQWCGHRAAAVLDGGLAAWLSAEGPVEAGAAVPPQAVAPYPLSSPLVPLVTREQVFQRLGSPQQTVLDARAAPRYRGEVEPLDPIAGHIPGALNRPFSENFGPDGRFKPADELRRNFEQVLQGADPATVVHHCGSGVSAVPNVLAMELAGLGRAPLFAGSWSEWSNTPGMPVEKG